MFEDQCSAWYGFFGLVKYAVINVGTFVARVSSIVLLVMIM